MTTGRTWTNDALMSDLAAYLRGPDRMVWEDMQLGPSGSPRPDVFTLQKSYSRPNPAAFEIKVSRSDLRSDTTSGKWQSYLKYAGSVTFAVPDGLCTVADIAEGCGLIVRKAEVWRYARRPTLQKVTPPFDACMKLLIDGVNRISAARQPVPRKAELWANNEAIRKKFGDNVARCARDLTMAEQRLSDTKSLANAEWERMRKEVELERSRLIASAKQELETWAAIRAEILDWLELGERASSFVVRQRVAALRAACDADERVQKIEHRLRQARRSVEAAGQSLAMTE